MLPIGILLALTALPYIAAKCTTTHTAYTTITGGTRTTTSDYPSTTYTHYSSTVLVETPYAGPRPFQYPDPPNPVNCHYYTGTDIPPATSSGISPSSAAQVINRAREANPSKCQTVQTTVTVEYLCVQTNIGYPPPVQISRKGVLTTRVPDFCTKPPKKSTGEVPDGSGVYPLSYPYFTFTPVDCCIYCSEQYKDVLASAYLSGAEECQCLVNTGGNFPGKSKFCPHGIEPYTLSKKKGIALLGACGKAP